MNPKGFNLLIIVFIVMIGIIHSSAQAPYTGGKGSGFSMANSAEVHIDANGKIGPATGKNVIFPNPVLSGSTLRLGFREIITSGFEIEIIDPLGQICMREKVTASGNDFEFRLPQLAQGIYLMRTMADGELQVRKLLIYSNK